MLAQGVFLSGDFLPQEVVDEIVVCRRELGLGLACRHQQRPASDVTATEV
jgi:hypothetical protein